ncbi:MAG: hypothetical protein COW32_09925 [Candidatus Aquicultor secundus]|uniref:Uncharacterized protein n=1 Tax=Candidatus Aquicultor secundus TaxID=1973895 RepID=A0A2M7T993_9ACTN|nr:hypothetical protein [Candidatus Aquicultor secundus]NCO65283.1 hypothetical protein [Solirubrobacter sp.]OIO83555.1 MAG: hypothetical protein AUK32_09830 [Candidatus Aquicultor secundus]PIU27241.1 MAG: hypothetical protein COT10_04505 [Candidatus Aquicultor secundus]PIW21441.1 MAG: hypothetical protein COW32_09925 [Candidatus Aquicultor secundus]PIX51689.1 MAG: hypothetical protein COZ51_08235 [Candidatus Aquicultor secundus]
MIEALNKTLRDSGLEEELKSFSISIAPRHISSHEELLKTVADFVPAIGWLCLTDEVLVVDEKFDHSSLQQRIILSGELASGDKSFHIRQADNGWIVVDLERKAGDDQIMIDEAFISTKQELGKLKYETYWKKAENDGFEVFRPVVSRFIGFERGEG